jgi:peroxiredoxin
MKKLFHLLLLCLLFSCAKNENACVVNGRYASAPDGTVLYVTPIDDILAPIDSVVVRGGKFGLELDAAVPSVRFISSQQVIDGGFVYVEPGVVNVDFAGDFVGGTPANERLNRFMVERDKIVNLRRMGAPGALDAFGLDKAMCDSIRDIVVIAGDIFDSYAVKEIKENIDFHLGYFYLVQSVGIVASAKLLPLLDKVPEEYRDKLYDTMRNRIESDVHNAAMAEKYLDDIWKSLEATAVGKKFQDFELDDINGGKVLLSDEVFANKYTLVLFWAGWQDSVKEQLQVLAEAYGKYKTKGLQIVGVSLDGDVAACRSVVDELDIAWVQLCNPAGGSAEVAAAYGITELPAAVLVNNRGTIISRMATVEDMLKKFEELF